MKDKTKDDCMQNLSKKERYCIQEVTFDEAAHLLDLIDDKMEAEIAKRLYLEYVAERWGKRMASAPFQFIRWLKEKNEI